MSKPKTGNRQFRVVLIKPSHYDEDGYVIQWVRLPVPSNSLAGVCTRSNAACSA